MYVIIQIGSLQYKVAEGDIISIEKLEKKENDAVTLEKVLLLSDGQSVRVGQPFLNNVRVTAKVLKDTKGEKELSFKYLRRKNHNWRRGHRQQLTNLSITKIAATS